MPHVIDKSNIALEINLNAINKPFIIKSTELYGSTIEKIDSLENNTKDEGYYIFKLNTKYEISVDIYYKSTSVDHRSGDNKPSCMECFLGVVALNLKSIQNSN